MTTSEKIQKPKPKPNPIPFQTAAPRLVNFLTPNNSPSPLERFCSRRRPLLPCHLPNIHHCPLSLSDTQNNFSLTNSRLQYFLPSRPRRHLLLRSSHNSKRPNQCRSPSLSNLFFGGSFNSNGHRPAKTGHLIQPVGRRSSASTLPATSPISATAPVAAGCNSKAS